MMGSNMRRYLVHCAGAGVSPRYTTLLAANREYTRLVAAGGVDVQIETVYLRRRRHVDPWGA